MLLSLCLTSIHSSITSIDIRYSIWYSEDTTFFVTVHILPDGLKLVLVNERPLSTTKLDTVIVHVKVAVFPAITDIELSDTSGTGTKGKQ